MLFCYYVGIVSTERTTKDMQKISDEKRQKIIDLYVDEGKGSTQIKEYFESKGETCSTSTVSRVLNAAGIKPEDRGTGKPNPAIDEDTKKEIIEKFAVDGYTLHSLSHIHNITYDKALNILESAGLTLDDRGTMTYAQLKHNKQNNNSYQSDNVTYSRNFKKGDVYYFNYDGDKGAPVVLYGNDYVLNQNTYIPILRIKPNKNRTVDVPISELNGDSAVVCEIQQVNVNSIGDYATSLTDDEIAAIDYKLLFNLDIGQTDAYIAKDNPWHDYEYGDMCLYPDPYFDIFGKLQYKMRIGVVLSDKEWNTKSKHIVVAQVTSRANRITKQSDGIDSATFYLTTNSKWSEVKITEIKNMINAACKPINETISPETMQEIKNKMIEFYGISVEKETTESESKATDDTKALEMVTLERDIYKDILYRMTGGKND